MKSEVGIWKWEKVGQRAGGMGHGAEGKGLRVGTRAWGMARGAERKGLRAEGMAHGVKR